MIWKASEAEGPCIVCDALGNKLNAVVECDTATGWVRQIEMKDGVLTDVEATYPAPLSIEKHRLDRPGTN